MHVFPVDGIYCAATSPPVVQWIHPLIPFCLVEVSFCGMPQTPAFQSLGRHKSKGSIFLPGPCQTGIMPGLIGASLACSHTIQQSMVRMFGRDQGGRAQNSTQKSRTRQLSHVLAGDHITAGCMSFCQSPPGRKATSRPLARQQQVHVDCV